MKQMFVDSSSACSQECHQLENILSDKQDSLQYSYLKTTSFSPRPPTHTHFWNTLKQQQNLNWLWHSCYDIVGLLYSIVLKSLRHSKSLL